MLFRDWWCKMFLVIIRRSYGMQLIIFYFSQILVPGTFWKSHQLSYNVYIRSSINNVLKASPYNLQSIEYLLSAFIAQVSKTRTRMHKISKLQCFTDYLSYLCSWSTKHRTRSGASICHFHETASLPRCAWRTPRLGSGYQFQFQSRTNSRTTENQPSKCT